MALTRSFIRNAATTPLDARLMDMAKIVANADGSPRVGVLGGANPSIVTTTATMNVTIAAAEFVTSKGKADGVAIFTNDGNVNVAIATAPASNSRIDVIYVKHNDNTTGDANSNPIFAVAQGTAAASPTKPAIPTGALELATLRVYAGTTATNGGSNTLTNTYQMTAARGGRVPFRTKADLDLWASATVGQEAFVLATGMGYDFFAGAWREGAGGAWSAYTPLTAGLTGSPTIVARYSAIGKRVRVRIAMRVTGGGQVTGIVQFSLPVPAATIIGLSSGGLGTVRDNSPIAVYALTAIIDQTLFSGAGGVDPLVFGPDGAAVKTNGSVTQTSPMTWAANDTLNLDFEYEAA